MMSTSPFARLFRSSSAKTADEDEAARRKAKRLADQEDGDEADLEDDVVDKVKDDAEDDLVDPDDPDAKKKLKKAKVKSKDGDDDSDEADDKDPKAKAARARERGRIAAIMASDAAATNPSTALFMALRTNASRDTVIADLPVGSLDKKGSNSSSARARLATVEVPDVGNDERQQPTNARALADAIVMAGKKRRGEI